MIVRAVSDSDSDSDDELLVTSSPSPSPLRRSVFDPPPSGSASLAQGVARRAQCMWLVVCVALVLLVLVDLAAVLGQWDAIQPTIDAFALLPMLLALLSPRSDEGMDSFPTATMANQFIGLALVGAWMYTRESSIAAVTATRTIRSRYGQGAVIALLCLGHVVSCLYLLLALLESNGDRTKFWLGRKHRNPTANTAPYGRI
ncbi:hypothetical protein BBJ28_00002220 [Nothophytophthora sp. Chile5]|nr:hypothetical protein BBJ28_00002220 [Nothophytophthora sp. Chile5]